MRVFHFHSVFAVISPQPKYKLPEKGLVMSKKITNVQNSERLKDSRPMRDDGGQHSPTLVDSQFSFLSRICSISNPDSVIPPHRSHRLCSPIWGDLHFIATIPMPPDPGVSYGEARSARWPHHLLGKRKLCEEETPDNKIGISLFTFP